MLPLPQLRLKIGHPLTQISLAVLLSPIHCVLLSTPPLLVLFSRPLGSVPLSSLFTKVDTMPHPRTTIPSLFSQFLVYKGFEKHDHIQLSQYLHTHNLLYPLQSGFRPSHSNQTLLLHCLHKWYKALDTKKYVGAVFLDISKALNTVRHELLLSKLTNLGLSSTATSWFRSCLSNRSQIICLLDSYSPRGFPLLGSLRALSLVPLCSLLSSMTVPLFFLSTQLFSLLMIRPSL